MQLGELFEARRFPEKNPKVVFSFEKYFEGHYYVSFTAIPKIGINPTLTWATPLGVYAYPMFAEPVQGYATTGDFPFGGGRPYVNVLEKAGNELLLSSIEPQHIQQLRTKFREEFGTTQPFDRISKYNSLKWDNDQHMFWNMTNFYTVVRMQGIKKYAELSAGDVASLHHRFKAKVTVQWNKTLRELGYDLVTDDVGGVIYSLEPFQTVFLNPRAFRLIERDNNPLNAGVRAISTVGQLIYMINKYDLDITSMVMDIMHEYNTRVSNNSDIQIAPNVDIGALLGQGSKPDTVTIDIIKSCYKRAADSPDKAAFFKAFVTNLFDPESLKYFVHNIINDPNYYRYFGVEGE